VDTALALLTMIHCCSVHEFALSIQTNTLQRSIKQRVEQCAHILRQSGPLLQCWDVCNSGLVQHSQSTGERTYTAKHASSTAAVLCCCHKQCLAARLAANELLQRTVGSAPIYYLEAIRLFAPVHTHTFQLSRALRTALSIMTGNARLHKEIINAIDSCCVMSQLTL
jgi:hypothetical protein